MIDKEEFIKKLVEQGYKDKKICSDIYEILKKHSIVGRKNKERIINDFIGTLGLTIGEANRLYNDSMKIIISHLF